MPNENAENAFPNLITNTLVNPFEAEDVHPPMSSIIQEPCYVYFSDEY